MAWEARIGGRGGRDLIHKLGYRKKDGKIYQQVFQIKKFVRLQIYFEATDGTYVRIDWKSLVAAKKIVVIN